MVLYTWYYFGIKKPSEPFYIIIVSACAVWSNIMYVTVAGNYSCSVLGHRDGFNERRIVGGHSGVYVRCCSQAPAQRSLGKIHRGNIDACAPGMRAACMYGTGELTVWQLFNPEAPSQHTSHPSFHTFFSPFFFFFLCSSYLFFSHILYFSPSNS